LHCHDPPPTRQFSPCFFSLALEQSPESRLAPQLQCKNNTIHFIPLSSISLAAGQRLAVQPRFKLLSPSAFSLLPPSSGGIQILTPNQRNRNVTFGICNPSHAAQCCAWPTLSPAAITSHWASTQPQRPPSFF
jgi:hypothetical protein